jgi:hypothetical protein
LAKKHGHTGISMILTRALVLLFPIVKSQMIKAKKRASRTATEAGKDTEVSPIRELTPKHAKRINNIPIGTYSHAVRFLCHDTRTTWSYLVKVVLIGCATACDRYSHVPI